VAYLDHARAGSLIPKFSKSDAEEVASYVGRLFDHDAERPALLRLLLWEALEYGPEPVAGEADRARRDYSANIEALTDAPRAGRIVERRASSRGGSTCFSSGWSAGRSWFRRSGGCSWAARTLQRIRRAAVDAAPMLTDPTAGSRPR
jgi:hypothetical protein